VRRSTVKVKEVEGQIHENGPIFTKFIMHVHSLTPGVPLRGQIRLSKVTV
jgi:hypothetical protein